MSTTLKTPAKAVLLDLGNVVLGIDFRRVFQSWADAAQVDVDLFYARWEIDQAYMDHEVGLIDFATYSQALTQRFNVQLSLAEWRAGWNNIWTEPFHSVIELLPQVSQRYALYGFSNTTDTHAACWRVKFSDSLSHFADIYVSSEIGLRKPDKAAFEYVCEDMGIAAEQIVFVDDTYSNVAGAAAAGLNARHIRHEQEAAQLLRSLLQ